MDPLTSAVKFADSNLPPAAATFVSSRFPSFPAQRYDSTQIATVNMDPIDVAQHYASQGLSVAMLNVLSEGIPPLLLKSNLYRSLKASDLNTRDIYITLDVSLISQSPVKVRVVSTVDPTDKWGQVLGAMFNSDIAVLPFNQNLYDLLNTYPGRFSAVILTSTGPTPVPTMTTPTLMCIGGKRDILGPSLERVPSNYLYIGRETYRGGWRIPRSKWYNPFSIKQYGRDGAIAHYYNYILSNPTLLNSLSELSGKVLLCWCAPEPCHGNVLIDLFRQRFG